MYSIGLGIADGLGLGANLKGSLVVFALEEMRSLVERFGGRPDTVFGSAGLGDLLATGFSSYSTNYSLGRELGGRGRSSIQSEGRHSLPILLSMLGRSAPEFRMLYALHAVIEAKIGAREALESLFD
jgi:glycerol-3-phosphate dehydrogenase (NAD(P)+)